MSQRDGLIALDRTPLADLTRADPAKLASRYGISVDHARGYLEQRKGS